MERDDSIGVHLPDESGWRCGRYGIDQFTRHDDRTGKVSSRIDGGHFIIRLGIRRTVIGEIVVRFREWIVLQKVKSRKRIRTPGNQESGKIAGWIALLPRDVNVVCSYLLRIVGNWGGWRGEVHRESIDERSLAQLAKRCDPTHRIAIPMIVHDGRVRKDRLRQAFHLRGPHRDKRRAIHTFVGSALSL